MKKFFTLVIILVFASIAYTYSAPGDKTIVRTIEFQERRTGWYDFPSTDKKYQQILLHYKLRCPPGKQCGEWDYLSYVFLNQWFAPSFKADKKVVQTLSYMKDTSWTYSQIDEGGVKKIVRSPKPAILLEFYNESENPTKRTDSMYVWSTYYTDYVFDDAGKAIDSVFVEPDSVINLTTKRVYFNDNVTYSERWEIFRYITPYGNGLNLGNGVTWTIDVTDLAPLLTGKVHLASPNGGWGDAYDQNSQEDLELTFEFIEGTPPRDVINIQRLWSFYHITYDKEFENHVAPVEYTFSDDEKTAVMRVVQSGHGFGGTADNCAEFCRKLGMAKVDGVKQYEQYVWRNCGDNAIYPQGGTWIFDRSNWCPGAEVKPYHYELTPFIQPGSTHTIDYDMEYYDLKWAGGDNTKPNWVIAGFLITYGDLNYNSDARLTEIISPNSDRIYNRFNPICGSPVIKIQNVGKEVITTVTIEWGNNPESLVSYDFTLAQPLKFMEEGEITLPNSLAWYDESSPSIFYAEITKVNGKQDENSTNNSKSANFIPDVPVILGNFTIEFKTPNSNVLGIPSPIKYYLEDMEGNLLYSRETTENDKEYKDDVQLENGCYRFTIVNTEGFGLGFWAYQNSGLKTGYLRFSINGNAYKTFTTDWGDYIIHEFRVSDIPEISVNVENDTLNFGDVLLGEFVDKEVEITPANEKGLVIDDIAVLLGTMKKYELIKAEPESSNRKYNLKYGEKVKLTLRFEPRSKGLKNTPLRITNNDYFNPEKIITLQGNGIDPTSVSDLDITNPTVELNAGFISRTDEIDVNITVDKFGLAGSIKVFDILGNIVLSIQEIKMSNVSNNLNLSALSLPSGVYLLRFDYQGTVSTAPIMISR